MTNELGLTTVVPAQLNSLVGAGVGATFAGDQIGGRDEASVVASSGRNQVDAVWIEVSG